MRYQRAAQPLKLDGLEAAREFFVSCFAESDPARECLWVAHIDAHANCLQLTRLDGEASEVGLPIRSILADATMLRSKGVLLAHNHPSGDAQPSASDCLATRRLAATAEGLGCSVVDHFIFDNKSEFVWIGIADPTADEIKALQDCYDLHPLAVEDSIKADQLPKVEVYGDQLFVVARTARLQGEAIEYGETAIFVGRHHIITVRHGSERAHTALREQLEKAPLLLNHGTDYLLHAVLDYIVDGYLPLVDEIEEDVFKMEEQAAESFLGRDDVNHIFALRRELSRLQRILVPMEEVTLKLARQHLPGIDDEARIYFRDVRDHVRRVGSRVDGLRDALTSVFEFSTLLEQQRTGRITRQLASWAAILAVPTAFAGIYGMNFENMPELQTRYGYFVVIGMIAAICAWLYTRFRRSGWL